MVKFRMIILYTPNFYYKGILQVCTQREARNTAPRSIPDGNSNIQARVLRVHRGR